MPIGGGHKTSTYFVELLFYWPFNWCQVTRGNLSIPLHFLFHPQNPPSPKFPPRIPQSKICCIIIRKCHELRGIFRPPVITDGLSILDSANNSSFFQLVIFPYMEFFSHLSVFFLFASFFSSFFYILFSNYVYRLALITKTDPVTQTLVLPILTV